MNLGQLLKALQECDLPASTPVRILPDYSDAVLEVDTVLEQALSDYSDERTEADRMVGLFVIKAN